VHFTDHHYNELIEIPGNTYDFNIASQRLRLYIDRAKQYFRSCGVGKVLVAMTGDMLNSDRRMDEILNMATNRAKALVLAEELLRHALLDLRKEFELTVAYVVGNESRIDKDMSWTPKTLTNNFDTMLFHWLESRLQDIQGIDFIHGPEVELVVSIDNYNVLLTHGIKLDPKNIDKSIGLIRSRYASKNQPIHYVLCGHIHSASISDLYGRGASLAGSNAYNEYGLNIEGRASQNAYILNKDGHVDGIKIDLQDTTGISGYPINTKLAAYSPQSAQQLQPNTTVIRIVV
jgi:predicted phosphodiesterase